MVFVMLIPVACFNFLLVVFVYTASASLKKCNALNIVKSVQYFEEIFFSLKIIFDQNENTILSQF